MAKEIERKFLVTNDELALSTCDILSSLMITQTYLSKTDNGVIRVRLIDDLLEGGCKAVLTIKSSNVGISRHEYEYDIPTSDAAELINSVSGHTICKNRVVLRDDNQQVWDVDFFTGMQEGLILAEIELADENQQVVIPDWVGEEVSNNPSYFNSNM